MVLHGVPFFYMWVPQRHPQNAVALEIPVLGAPMAPKIMSSPCVAFQGTPKGCGTKRDARVARESNARGSGGPGSK